MSLEAISKDSARWPPHSVREPPPSLAKGQADDHLLPALTRRVPSPNWAIPSPQPPKEKPSLTVVTKSWTCVVVSRAPRETETSLPFQETSAIARPGPTLLQEVSTLSSPFASGEVGCGACPPRSSATSHVRKNDATERDFRLSDRSTLGESSTEGMYSPAPNPRPGVNRFGHVNFISVSKIPTASSRPLPPFQGWGLRPMPNAPPFRLCSRMAESNRRYYCCCPS